MNVSPESIIDNTPSLNSDSDFKGIVDISPYPIFIHRGGIVKYVNHLAKQLIGADEVEDLIGANIMQYCHPDDLRILAETIDQVHATRISGIQNFRLLARDGAVKPLQARSAGINFGGELCRLVYIYNFDQITQAEEISKAKQTELLHYRSFQEKINSTSPVMVTIIEIAKMTSIYRSKDMAQWLNYLPGTLPERSLDLIHPEYKEDAIASIMKVAKLNDGEILSTVYPFLSGNGAIRFLLTRSTVFQRDESGEATHILLAHSDITDLKETESRLDKSEETRKAILYTIPDMVVIVSTDGVISDFYPNDLYRQEFEAVEIKGKNIIDILEPEHYIEIKKVITHTIQENKLHYYTLEERYNGKSYHFELRISPFSDGGVIVLIRDITEQKETQNKIDHYNKQLIEKNQQLERYITSNSELEKFAYIASHDLREPLRSLIGFAQLLQKRNEGHLTRESEEFIENIIQCAQRMNTLVSGLLEYSRISSVGKPFTHVNLTDLLKKVQSDLKISIEESKSDLVIFELPEIYCDELQIRQLFQNLISNAIKFRSESTPIIKISAERADRHWLFKVEDNGIGVDMKFKDQVFQIFSRLHSQDKYPGSGIGLSICKKILERHGGQIWLESAPGQGTSIFFTILS